MIATYDLTGWIAVGLGFITVILAVAGDHYFTRRMERRDHLQSAGVNAPRLSNGTSNKTARAGSEGRESREAVTADVSTVGPGLLPPTRKNSFTTGGRAAGTADPVTHAPDRRAR